MQAAAFLHKDRSIEGVLYFSLDDGRERRFRCLGKSDQHAADSVGNSARDPLKKFGDLPCGVYRAKLIGPAKPMCETNTHSYGPGDRWLLRAISGDALEANRPGLLIHGGALGAPMPPNALRPTHGCLRVDDATVSWMSSMLPVEFELSVIEGNPPIGVS